MAHEIHETDAVPNPAPSFPSADTLQGERDHLQALRRRLEAAVEALSRVRDQLQTRASRCEGGDEVSHPDPEEGRQ